MKKEATILKGSKERLIEGFGEKKGENVVNIF